MKDIDIVIPWVDGSDLDWLKEKSKYQEISIEESRMRFRDWDNMQFVFRGIEKFMPWVRTVHFVTYGHVPKWLNVNAEKLHIVKHTDYIPHKYLPTYSSHCIELNFNKIEGLSEQFIYFNDDTFVLRKMKPEEFFKNGRPCDSAVLNLLPNPGNNMPFIILNNMEVLAKYFGKTDILNNKRKWFCPQKYGASNLRTLILLLWNRIPSFYEPHIQTSFLKSTFDTIWEKEYDKLDATCKNKFRTKDDVNQWLVRGWQLLSGNFEPRNMSIGKMFAAGAGVEKECEFIEKRKYALMCINDDESVTDFEETKRKINGALKKILPEKSQFEL